MKKRPHRIIRTRGQRIAWTNTSRIPDKELIEAVKFVAAEVDLDKVVIHFKAMGDDSATYGRAYGGIPTIANLDGLKRHEWRYLIIVRDQGIGQVSPRFINTLAHEGKHIEQFRGRNYTSREPRARAFGAWVADRWEAAQAVS
ncbi:MAG TPA: hypothetical protein VKD72_28900 [Gemmataceae bacterium]|nr:hypothetical protein [Gemmataceae bacterium]